MAKTDLLARNILTRVTDGDTPIEVAELYGISEIEVVATVKKLLSDNDFLTALEERQLMVYKLKAFLKKAESFLDYADARTAAPLLDSVGKLIKQITELQERHEAITEEETRQYALAQAALIMEVVQSSYQRARDLLSHEYPMVDLNKLDTAFQKGVREVAASHSTRGV